MTTSAHRLPQQRQTSSSYDGQDRGNTEQYHSYLEAMDAIAMEKVASASAFFEPRDDTVLVDVGMASGTSSALLARLFPRQRVIGVDVNAKMVETAQQRYGTGQYPNLSFRVDDGETLRTFGEVDPTLKVHGFFNCSSLHHVTSFNGYDHNRALLALHRQAALLEEGGVIVVRDFVKPEEKVVVLELRAEPTEAQRASQQPSDAELLLQFSRTARSLAHPQERGFPVEELPAASDCPATAAGPPSSSSSSLPCYQSRRRFRLFLTDATEFIRRKDYYGDWEVELQEEYGYFTQSQFEHLFHDLGMRVILAAPIYNRWIVKHRYVGQFRLLSATASGVLEEIGHPPTNFLIAAEKVGPTKGRLLSLVRHVPLPAPPYLTLSSYRHTGSGRVYDVVRRPSEVMDILPYYFELRGGGSKEGERALLVVAKHGYPRPLLNVREVAAGDAAGRAAHGPLDEKHCSGYITEGIAVATGVPLMEALAERCGIGQTVCGTPSVLYAGYYTSPGGVSERVSSTAVELTRPVSPGPLPTGFTGFAESGYVHSYDARQLLLTAQTGALVEARLEMNVYRLLEQLNVPLPPWLGEPLVVTPGPVPANVQSLASLLARRHACFEALPQTEAGTARFLELRRAHFAEHGVRGSCTAFEYVYPRELSENTLLTLPLHAVGPSVNDFYVGLEVRELPVPQLYPNTSTGTYSSTLLTLPAIRLSRQVRSLFELQRFLSSSYCVGGRRVVRYAPLGEKYYPSVGVTTEQVYPFVVALEEEVAKGVAGDGDGLVWVAVTELFANMAALEDAHLLIALSRLRHMLSKKKE